MTVPTPVAAGLFGAVSTALPTRLFEFDPPHATGEGYGERVDSLKNCDLWPRSGENLYILLLKHGFSIRNAVFECPR